MIGTIALVQTTERTINQLQLNIKQAVEPVLKNPLVQGQFLNGQALVIGSNVINHGLGRTMQGWMVTDVNAAANIYRSAALNDKTLTLTSDVAVTVNIYIF